MSQTRSDAAASDPPLLINDIWLSVILPKLDKKDLYTLSSVSKEARQLVFHGFFKKKDFSERINQEITRLTTLIEMRYSPTAPGFETALHATIGNTPALLAQKLALVGSEIILAFLVKNTLSNPDSVSSSRSLLLAGLSILVAAQHYAFSQTNKTCMDNDKQAALYQQEFHRKRYGLSYLRDELPGLVIPDRRLVAPPYGIGRDEPVVTPKIIDKSGKYYVESFFSKWKYAFKDIYRGYLDACEYERKWGSKL
jgi:hypothetical protein